MNSSSCSSRPRVDPYVDGALDAVQILETERHLESCPCCRESASFLVALKSAVKKSAELEVPDDFAGRMMTAAKARAAQTAPAPVSAKVTTPARMATLMTTAMAIAAGAVVVISVRYAEAARVTPAETLGEFMAEHRSPLPVDTREVHELERYVGMPVHAPALRGQQLKLMGGRVLPVMQARAAMLQYEVDRNGTPGRMSVFIYDPSKIRVDDDTFEDRRVGEARVRVGRANGYSVAVTQRSGVGYVLASDMGTSETAQMAGQFE